MRTLLWPAAVLAALVASAACGDSKPPPTVAPFGLDTRPSNTTCMAKPRPLINTGVQLQPQFPGVTFDTPMYMVQAPGDDTKWYVAQRGSAGSAEHAIAKVRVVPVGATSNSEVTDFVTLTVNNDGEGGLLSLAFHPQWPTKPEVYLSYTRAKVAGDPAIVCAVTADAGMTSIVARYSSSNGMVLDSGPDEILKVGQPFTNHKAGTINFGPDGYLYLSLGDGGDGNDTCMSGQNLNTLLGKILRFDINAPAGMYNIPADNPFVGMANTRGEIWTYGHRNPFRWSFDTATGDLWTGDVGQSTWEEIDRDVKGGNYGWNICEGFHKRGSTTDLCDTPGLIDPVDELDRTEASAIIGGRVYRGTAMPSLVGTYIFGDDITGNIWAETYDSNNNGIHTLIANVPPNTLAAFAQDHAGEIYTVGLDGTINKLVPSDAMMVADPFPQHLSDTGCVDPSDPTKPASGLIPYDVNTPLWSDGADKDRYFAIPDGQTITITADQDFDLPIGSVAMKTFSVDGNRVETRLFMHHADGGWAGYSYEWDADGKDATLLPAGKVKMLDSTQSWTYPSRSQCIQCHSLATGSTIGLETAQLNRDEVYPSTNRQSNQLATLDHIGVFAAPLGVDPSAEPRLSPDDSTDPIDARARSYLHANCAHCHRPNGGGQGTMDLRYQETLAQTATCNATNTQGVVGGATEIIVPGMPMMSILSLRVHASDSSRMPPVAVSIVDPVGSQLIDDWITQLTCPTM